MSSATDKQSWREHRNFVRSWNRSVAVSARDLFQKKQGSRAGSHSRSFELSGSSVLLVS
jgi:hypothetical protein